MGKACVRHPRRIHRRMDAAMTAVMVFPAAGHIRAAEI